MSETHTVLLDEEQARYVNGLVRTGRYRTGNDVVSAGLQALRERDAEEDWLRNDVVPVAAAMMADPTRAIPIDDVFDDIRRLHESRTSGRDS